MPLPVGLQSQICVSPHLSYYVLVLLCSNGKPVSKSSIAQDRGYDPLPSGLESDVLPIELILYLLMRKALELNQIPLYGTHCLAGKPSLRRSLLSIARTEGIEPSILLVRQTSSSPRGLRPENNVNMSNNFAHLYFSCASNFLP